MTESKTARVKLDWSRLLGFDQANASAADTDAARSSQPGPAALGTKTGTKPGAKFGIKVGVKRGVKAGVKFAL